MTAPRGLKLRAEDEADLQIIGACLQDALVPICDMIWLRDERRFAMVVNRFMWEVPPEQVAPEDGADEDEIHTRINGILSFQKVKAVRLRNIEQTDRERILNLLTLRGRDDGVDLEFAGGGTVRIETDAIDCYLEDVGAPWPTKSRPAHDAAEPDFDPDSGDAASE